MYRIFSNEGKIENRPWRTKIFSGKKYLFKISSSIISVKMKLKINTKLSLFGVTLSQKIGLTVTDLHRDHPSAFELIVFFKHRGCINIFLLCCFNLKWNFAKLSVGAVFQSSYVARLSFKFWPLPTFSLSFEKIISGFFANWH